MLKYFINKLNTEDYNAEVGWFFYNKCNTLIYGMLIRDQNKYILSDYTIQRE